MEDSFTLFLVSWVPDSSFRMSSTVPARSEVPESDKWNLTQLFADAGKWQGDFAWLQRAYPKLQEWKGRVGESAQTLAAVLEFEKALELKMERVHHYASLQLAEDSTNNEYLARIGQLQNLLTKIGEAAASLTDALRPDAANTWNSGGRTPRGMYKPPVLYVNGVNRAIIALQSKIQDLILKDALLDKDEAVPPQYKKYVEEYYRMLSEDLRK